MHLLSRSTGLLVALSLAACGDSTPESKTPDKTTTTMAPPTTTTVTPPAGAMGSGMGAAGAGAMGAGAMAAAGAAGAAGAGTSAPDAARAPARLTDAEIGAVMDAANSGEIEEAKVAQKSGQNAGVKSFATMMVTHHTEARDKQAKLFSKLALAPTDSAKSRDVKAEGQKNLDTIKALKGAEFDRAYIDAQVKEHTAVLKTLDEDILPAVQSAEYKTLLQEVRGKVEQHLKAAQDLQTKLGKTGG